MKYLRHPQLKRKQGETEKEFFNRKHRVRAARRRAILAAEKPKKAIKPGQRAKLDAPLKIIHDWIADRDIHEAHVVLRIDDYKTEPFVRGQFYPAEDRNDDKMKAIWPNRTLALAAAEWAVRKYGRMYGVFRMVAIMEQAVRPVRVVEV